MNVQFFLTALALCPFGVFSQHHLSASLNSGIGKSALLTDFDSEIAMQTTIEDRFSMTYNAQLTYTFQKNHWLVETGLAYSMIKGSTTETFNVYDFFNQFNYSVYTAEETRRSHYLTLPLLLHYTFNKLSFGAGVYGSLKLTDYSAYEFYIDDMPSGFQQGGNRLSKFDLGASAKLHYSITEKIGLQSQVNIGFLDVSNGSQTGAMYQTLQLNEATNRQLKNRQLLLGITYRIL